MSGLMRPVRDAVLGFLGVTLAMVLLAVANRMGAIDHDLERRGMGAAIGVMLLLAGNLLPKMRLLKLAGAESGRALSGERTAGWALALAGLVMVGLFAMAPLAAARHASAVIGVGVVILVVTDWAWLSRDDVAPSAAADGPVPDRRTSSRVTTVYLLYGVLYALSAACLTFAFDDRRLVREYGEWLGLAFWMGFAVLHAIFGRRRRRCRPVADMGGTHA